MERCRHFFLYLFHYKALTDRLNTRHGQSFEHHAGVSRTATHQVDAGLRSDDPAYYGFDPKDPSMIDKPATACGSTDAAHYCNLGIEAKFQAKIAALANPVNDRVAFDLYEHLKIISGNTKWLPQRINIGPDRVIDEKHGVLAIRMLDGTPPVSMENLNTYLSEVGKALAEYASAAGRKGSKGVEACTCAYVRFYDDAKAVSDLWSTLTGNVHGECFALGLPVGEYLKY